MKIVHLLDGFPTAITNEEREFARRHPHQVKLHSLNEHDQWVAQNLVRKGIFTISNDNITLINKLDEDAP